jgi:hypothetical protein
VISWFRFVVHAEVAIYERQGWTVVAHLGPVHGAYAVLMRWSGKNKPDAATEIPDERGVAPLQQGV